MHVCDATAVAESHSSHHTGQLSPEWQNPSLVRSTKLVLLTLEETFALNEHWTSQKSTSSTSSFYILTIKWKVVRQNRAESRARKTCVKYSHRAYLDFPFDEVTLRENPYSAYFIYIPQRLIYMGRTKNVGGRNMDYK
jgi:hypothetical protein